jgi:hypothetical protein
VRTLPLTAATGFEPSTNTRLASIWPDDRSALRIASARAVASWPSSASLTGFFWASAVVSSVMAAA